MGRGSFKVLGSSLGVSVLCSYLMDRAKPRGLKPPSCKCLHWRAHVAGFLLQSLVEHLHLAVQLLYWTVRVFCRSRSREASICKGSLKIGAPVCSLLWKQDLFLQDLEGPLGWSGRVQSPALGAESSQAGLSWAWSCWMFLSCPSPCDKDEKCCGVVLVWTSFQLSPCGGWTNQ